MTAADVLEKDPSVRPSGTKGGILDAFFIRGFPIGEGNLGEVAFNGMFGVAPNYRVMADYAERIEVVKGPSALLNGMSPNSSVGGTINIVPKRATITGARGSGRRLISSIRLKISMRPCVPISSRQACRCRTLRAAQPTFPRTGPGRRSRISRCRGALNMT